MPDELTPAQRDAIRARLLELREELRSLLADDSGLADTVELDQGAVGRISRVDALQAQAMAKAGLERMKLRLVRVDAALERFDEDPDEFDLCPRCEEPIGWRRLQAVPESIFCVGCADGRRR